MEGNKEGAEGCYCKEKIYVFVLRAGKGRWRQQCRAGGNGKGRSGGRCCALRNGGAGRRARLDGGFTDPQVDHAALPQRNRCLYLFWGFIFFPTA